MTEASRKAVLQPVALRDGILRGQHLRARALGLWVLRVGLLSLLVANLLAFH